MNMDTVLLFDRGNRALKAALCCSGEITRRWRGETGDAVQTIAAILDACKPRGVVFSSVVPEWSRLFRETVRRRGVEYVVEAGPGICLPFGLLVKSPEKLGTDRIAAACGVAALNHTEAVIVDAGTAVTVDLLSREGFLGGAIFPGIDMILRSLHDGTGSLPRIRFEPCRPELPGRDTEGAMTAGAFWGWIGAVRELVARSGASLDGEVPVFVTGGDAHYIAPHCPGEVTIDQDLVFHGLLLMFEMNV